jgi:hypothetical protein
MLETAAAPTLAAIYCRAHRERALAVRAALAWLLRRHR